MDSFGLEKVVANLARTKREVLVVMSNQAQNYFLSSFKKQGFDGKKWQEVKRRMPGTSSYKYPKGRGLQRRTSPILVGAGWKVRGGGLRLAVGNMAQTAQFNGTEQVSMRVNSKVGKYHNEGGDHLPQRQFVGTTMELNKMQIAKMEQIVDRIWKL